MIKHVSHIFLIDWIAKPSEIETILTSCTDIINLVVWLTPAHHLRGLSALTSVRRLTIEVEALFEPLLDTLFLNVPHLELYFDAYHDFNAGPGTRNLCARLTLIPHLTHITLYPWSMPRNPTFHTTLAADTRLKCTVYFAYNPDWLDSVRPILKDSRVVAIDFDLLTDDRMA